MVGVVIAAACSALFVLRELGLVHLDAIGLGLVTLAAAALLLPSAERVKLPGFEWERMTRTRKEKADEAKQK